MSDGQLPLPVDPAAMQQMLTQMPAAANGQAAPPAAMQPPPVQSPAPQAQLPDTSQSQPASGPPKQSFAPLLARVLQNAFKGPGYAPATGGGPGDMGAQPGRPGDRASEFEGFLGEFLDSFSKGMANSGTGPGANARGFGAGVQAPYQRQLGEYQVGQQAQAQQATIGQTEAETALKQAQARVEAAGAQKQFLSTPFGVMDTKTGNYVGGSGAGGIGATVKMTKEMADSGQYGPGAEQLIDRYVKLSDLSGMERSTAQGTKMVQGVNGPAAYNVGSGQATDLGLGNPGAGRPVQVGDPRNPGNTIYVSGQRAMQGGMAGPTSASVTIPAASLKYFTSGPGGQTLTNFRTATDHAGLLLNLGNALDSGDYPAINAAKQAWETATGAAAPSNFQLVREALADEVSKGFAGQPSVAGSAGMRDRILKAPSMDQLEGIAQTVAGLMQSKVNELGVQHRDAMQGKPNFSTPSAGQNKIDALVSKYGAK